MPHIVETATGRLRGVRRGRSISWLGIPYAAPPTGRLRFAPPAPAQPWAGVRAADTVGPSAPQKSSILAPATRVGPAPDEDCLYLNVHTPSAANPPGGSRPVLVWIHGGAFTGGAGAAYDGARLAADGDLVVVSINYRLGVFGFVDFAAVLDVDQPANLGLRDQIAALRWVATNIAAFGGDPARVTVAGESAGSISVALLMAAPSTAGLFRGAIMESGTYSLIHGAGVSRQVAARYLEQLQLRPGDAAQLHALPTAALMAAQYAVDKAIPGTVAAAPSFDGDVVPDSLAAAQAAVRPGVAVLAGRNRDEIRLFQLLPGDILPTRRAPIAARLLAELGQRQAAEILDSYPHTLSGTRALATDFTFAMPTENFAQRHAAAGGAAYVYRFDAGVPVLGATHACELPYVWGWSGPAALALRGLPTRARTELGVRMRRLWSTFVHELCPGPDWPAYMPDRRSTRIFRPAGDEIRDDPSAARRAAWAGADVMPHA